MSLLFNFIHTVGNTDIYKQSIAWYIYACDPGKRVTLHIETYLCCKHFDNSLSLLYVDGVAEWLWRWTANPMGSARVGSNPISVEDFFSFQIYKKDFLNSRKTQQKYLHFYD